MSVFRMNYSQDFDFGKTKPPNLTAQSIRCTRVYSIGKRARIHDAALGSSPGGCPQPYQAVGHSQWDACDWAVGPFVAGAKLVAREPDSECSTSQVDENHVYHAYPVQSFSVLAQVSLRRIADCIESLLANNLATFGVKQMFHSQSALSRRGFLATGGAAAALTTAASLRADDAVAAKSETEAKNEKLITKMCAEIAHLDSAKIAPFIGDDIVFQLIDGQPLIKGKEAFLASGEQFFAPYERAEFIIHRSHSIGNLVINHRDDHFYPKDGGKRTTFTVSGFFVVKDGKIVEWRDYAIPS
jgi:limonene-1,2-epoxide hydrolase